MVMKTLILESERQAVRHRAAPVTPAVRGPVPCPIVAMFGELSGARRGERGRMPLKSRAYPCDHIFVIVDHHCLNVGTKAARGRAPQFGNKSAHRPFCLANEKETENA